VRGQGLCHRPCG